MCEKNLLLY